MNLLLVMKPFWPLAFIVLLCLGWYLACFNVLQIGQQVDDASYVTLARSIASGQGYRMVVYPGAPVETKYPPLLPVLIAGLFRLLGDHLWVARLPALLCMLAAIPVLWALLRRFIDGWALWLLVALVGLHPWLAGYAGAAMTEAPSLLLTWLALLLLLQAQDRRGPLRYVLVGVVLGLALLLRIDSLALAFAVVLWLAVRRQWRQGALVAAPAALLFTPWAWHVWLHGRSAALEDNYLREVAVGWWDPSSPWALRLWHDFVAYAFGYIPNLVTLVLGEAVEHMAASRGLSTVVTAAAVLLGLVVIIGFVRSWRLLPAVISLWIIVRMGLLICFAPVSRYLLPLLPFLLIYFVAGLALWRRPRRLDELRRPLVVVCLLVMFPALVRDAALVVHPPRLDYPDVVAGGELVARHTPPGAAVLSNWCAESFALHSGRLAVTHGAGTWQRGPDALLDRAPAATHLLLVGPPHQPVDLQAYLKSPRLQLVAEQPDRSLWLFRIRG